MKKNKWMRLAALMLVLCMITTCAICGTYAKYISSDSATDVARVAKFGVVASISGDLFGPTYLGNASHNKITDWGLNTETVSAATAAENVVAPGTTGDDIEFSVLGKPEVSTTVAFQGVLKEDGTDAKFELAEPALVKGSYGVLVPYSGILTNESIQGLYYTADKVKFVKVESTDTYNASLMYYELNDACDLTANYYPISWSWKYGGANGTATDIVNSIAKAFDGLQGSLTSSANFVPNAQINERAKLTWDWFFEGDLDDTANVPNNPAVSGTIYSKQDKADTMLGDMIAMDSATGALDGGVVCYKNADGYYIALASTSVPVISDASNEVTVVYGLDGSAPAAAYTASLLGGAQDVQSTGVLAVLGVAFGASLTCTQVD